MRAEAIHDPVGVGVRVAAGKADQLHPALTPGNRNLARDVVRTLDEIRHHHMIADALAAVLPSIAFHVGDSCSTVLGSARVNVGK